MAAQKTSAVDPLVDCARSGDGRIRITGFHIESTGGLTLSNATSGQPFVAVISYQRSDEPLSNVSVGLSIHTESEYGLFLNYSHFSDVLFSDIPVAGDFTCRVDDCPLAPGSYLVMLRIMSGAHEIDWPKIYVPISVVMGDFFSIGGFEGRLASWGPFLVRGTWSVRTRKPAGHQRGN